MSGNKPPFAFLTDPNGSTTKHDFIVEVPTGIQTKMDLFVNYEKEGAFPPYFGRNWDALLDCLRDFSWTKRKRIVITHNDLPLVNRVDELRVYLDILKTAVKDWKEVRQGPFTEPPDEMPFVKHELMVIFPSTMEETVTRLLDSENP
jgi:Barstar (barnase inhibitor)